MAETALSFKAGITELSGHDTSVVVMEDGDVVFGIEQERVSREKHGTDSFPFETIEHALDESDRTLSDIDRVVLPYDPGKSRKRLESELAAIENVDGSASSKREASDAAYEDYRTFRFGLEEKVREKLARIGSTVPEIETVGHHRAHAVSAFYPSGMDEALVLTIDGAGESESTVVWWGTTDELERIDSFSFPNSLGYFYGIVTAYLGYRMLNGEGKVMGLAPYGEYNEEIDSKLREVLDVSAEYDVTALTTGGRYSLEHCVSKLEDLLGHERNRVPREFTQWYKDVAFATQQILEEIVVDLVEKYIDELGTTNVCLAGGIALNCKANKSIVESDSVDSLFVQPVANDAGVALGGAMDGFGPEAVGELDTIYYGTEYSSEYVSEVVSELKIDHREPDDVARETAEMIANGGIVGWFQGRSEMGPRALGNRSILADPRTDASRKRVNNDVKHREEWRPFAPSFLADSAGAFLETDTEYPFMIKTSEVFPEKTDEVSAVIHPQDGTTRPQVVRRDQNQKYYRLLSEFESITGVPAVLNTSFNDHGEPIVETPRQAIRDFYSMGLDALVIEDTVIEK